LYVKNNGVIVARNILRGSKKLKSPYKRKTMHLPHRGKL